jgi:hypothetical protein
MTDLNRTLIVKAIDKAAAVAAGAAAGGGEGMFSVPLADAANPTVITYWACSGYWPQSVIDVMWPSVAVVQDADAEGVFATLDRLSLVMWSDPNP